MEKSLPLVVKGRGDANLYHVEVALFKDGNIIDTQLFRHGMYAQLMRRTGLTLINGGR